MFLCANGWDKAFRVYSLMRPEHKRDTVGSFWMVILLFLHIVNDTLKAVLRFGVLSKIIGF